jgi:hypothetical protein
MRITADEVSDALFTPHEISCALKMHLLTSLFEPTIASYIACVGRHRMMVPSKFLRVFAMTRMIPNTAWLLLLHLRYFYKVELPILPHLRWNLNDLTDAECNKYFRFSHRNIQMLVTKLEFPDVLITPNRDRIMSVEAFCLLLRRLSYPNRWVDLKDNFGRHPSSMSRILQCVMNYILLRIKVSLLFYPLNAERLQQYATAFLQRGVPPIIQLFSVIDTKKQQICRPSRHQRAFYSGHKRMHCVKYQTLEGPDGLFLHVSPCNDGRRGDGYILRKSRLQNFLEQNHLFNGYYVLGDSAYPNNNVMVSIFRGNNLPAAAEAFNRVMCPIRTCVEWGYAKIVRYWAFVDFKKQMKVQSGRIEAMWRIAAFLTNAVLCAKGYNQISKYFDLPPPTLDQFLDNTMNAYRNMQINEHEL